MGRVRERKREVKGAVFCGVVLLLLAPFAPMGEIERATAGVIFQPSKKYMPPRYKCQVDAFNLL